MDHAPNSPDRRGVEYVAYADWTHTRTGHAAATHTVSMGDTHVGSHPYIILANDKL